MFSKSDVVLKGFKGKNIVRLVRIWRLGFAITWNYSKGH